MILWWKKNLSELIWCLIFLVMLNSVCVMIVVRLMKLVKNRCVDFSMCIKMWVVGWIWVGLVIEFI